MSQLSFEERVKRELGEGVNPLYIETILAMDDTRFIEWLSGELKKMHGQTLMEFRMHLSQEGELHQAARQFGLNIMTRTLRRWAFVLNERYQEKFNAIDIAP